MVTLIPDFLRFKMSTNNVNLTSIEDILVYARKALNEMELELLAK